MSKNKRNPEITSTVKGDEKIDIPVDSSDSELYIIFFLTSKIYQMRVHLDISDILIECMTNGKQIPCKTEGCGNTGILDTD